MTTFNSTRDNDFEARTLEVDTYKGMANICIKRSKDTLGLTLDAGTVPEIALAAIAAAGVKPHFHGNFTHGTPEHLESITANLAAYIKARDAAAEREKLEAERLAKVAAEKAAAEAADLAELEKLARTIYEGYTGTSAHLYPRWEMADSTLRSHWLNSARAAREALSKS